MTCMPGGVTGGKSCLCCCVQCLSSAIFALCLVNLIACTDYEQAVQQKMTELYTDGQERAKEKEFTKFTVVKRGQKRKNLPKGISRQRSEQRMEQGPLGEF